MTQTGIRCLLMRGGTSKGAYFLASDLPDDPAARDKILMAVMGSPDKRQIDGVGGADPLTSKVAVINKSTRPGFDVDYLFLQVFVDQALVSDQQNCGNILAGVAPFAIERGLVKADDPETRVRIFMVNTAQTVVATVRTPGGEPTYEGDARIDGVPGTSSPIALAFSDTAGSTCGALLPTGHTVDIVDGIECTLLDNGMPIVVMRASDLGRTGYETREQLDNDVDLKTRIEAIRLKVGPLMKLGDVNEKSVPKMFLVAPPREGGVICTRSYIPHRAHASIGVFAALTVATACLLPDGPARSVAQIPPGARKRMLVEHPTGASPVIMDVEERNGQLHVREGALVNTARPLMDGQVFVPSSVLEHSTAEVVSAK